MRCHWLDLPPRQMIGWRAAPDPDDWLMFGSGKL